MIFVKSIAPSGIVTLVYRETVHLPFSKWRESFGGLWRARAHLLRNPLDELSPLCLHDRHGCLAGSLMVRIVNDDIVSDSCKEKIAGIPMPTQLHEIPSFASDGPECNESLERKLEQRK